MKVAETLIQNCCGWGTASADFLFPPECCFCSQSHSTTHNSNLDSIRQICQPLLCGTCAEKLPPVTNNHCLKCGATQGPYIPAGDGCIYCRSSQFSFSGAISLHLYEGHFRKMCQLCKQKTGQRLAWNLTGQLWQCEQNRLQDWQCDAIVHVPMHWTRRLSRHVHPAESMANCLAKNLHIPHYHRALKQTRLVPHQARLPPSKRRKNVQNIYQVTRFHNFKQKTILLVDDILTTGTTASECAKALKKAGAKKVYVAVLARGIGR